MFENFWRKPKQDVSIWPRSASKSIESLSQLFCTMAFPFSGWKHPNWECCEENERLFKPACNAFQVEIFFSKFLNKCDDGLLAELARGTFIETAKSGCKDFAEALEYFLKVQDISMTIAAENGEVQYAEVLAVIAMGLLTLEAQSNKTGWCSDPEDTTQDKRVNDLCKYLAHARTQALSAFEPMVNAIVDFDVDNFSCLSFRKNRAVFEEVLWRRVEFPELFSEMPKVSSALILEARRRERDSCLALVEEQKQLFLVIREQVDRVLNNRTSMSEFAKHYFKSISEIDDLSQKAFGIGGECLSVYEKLLCIRNTLVEMSSQDELLASMVKTCDECRNLMLMSKISGALQWVEPSEILQFILADTEEEIKSFAEFTVANNKTLWNSEQLFSALSNANILQNLTTAQLGFVNRRVRILTQESPI